MFVGGPREEPGDGGTPPGDPEEALAVQREGALSKAHRLSRATAAALEAEAAPGERVCV